MLAVKLQVHQLDLTLFVVIMDSQSLEQQRQQTHTLLFHLLTQQAQAIAIQLQQQLVL